MLLRFGFENLWSFRDRVDLSFVATAQRDDPPYTLPIAGLTHGALPVLALYGANASGKSNILHAMSFLWGELRDSFKRDPDAPIPRTPFLLRPDARQHPSRLDCDVSIGGVRYHYGVEIDDRVVREEWLYSWATHRRAVVFHRQGGAREDWYFGPSLKGRNRQIADFTRDNCLFLSAAAQHNHPGLGDLYRALSEQLVIGDAMPARSGRLYAEEDPLLQEKHRIVVTNLLRSADLGITDLRVRDPEDTITKFVDEFSTALGETRDSQERARQWILKKVSEDPRKYNTIELGHQAEHGVEYFDDAQESLGTRTLLKLLTPVFQTMDTGTTLVLDELGSGLHPRLVAALIALFTSPHSNPRGAQLLFTTHDSLYMDVLRRDEIGLVEKDARGCSNLRTLSDYDIRQRDNWRRGYESGRFGGVPILGNLTRTSLKA